MIKNCTDLSGSWAKPLDAAGHAPGLPQCFLGANFCRLPAVLPARPPRTKHPGARGTRSRCRGLRHARLVVVSTGRKMVPLPCLWADLALREMQNSGGATGGESCLCNEQRSLEGFGSSPGGISSVLRAGVQLMGFPLRSGVAGPQGSWIPRWELQEHRCPLRRAGLAHRAASRVQGGFSTPAEGAGSNTLR